MLGLFAAPVPLETLVISTMRPARSERFVRDERRLAEIGSNVSFDPAALAVPVGPPCQRRWRADVGEVSWSFLDRHARQLRLVGIGRGDPDATIARVDDALGAARACILDVHFFAGVQTVLSFEVPRSLLPALARGLSQAGVELDEASRVALEARAQDGEPSESVEGTLAITLAHGDPDLRHEVPAVPG